MGGEAKGASAVRLFVFPGKGVGSLHYPREWRKVLFR